MKDIKITYKNHSMNQDNPSVFVFTKNEIPTFDALKDGVAWKVIERIGRGSQCTFAFPVETQVGASWDSGSCQTTTLDAAVGEKYSVTEDSTGIVLLNNGNAAASNAIDVVNNIHTPGGISVNLYKDDRLLMSKNIVAYDQKATFVLHPKLYWGLASEIQEGDLLSSAVLDSDHFFEMDLESVSEITVGLYGNATDGYEFKIDSQK